MDTSIGWRRQRREARLASNSEETSGHAHISEGRTLGKGERAPRIEAQAGPGPAPVSQQNSRGSPHPEGSYSRLMGWGPEGPNRSAWRGRGLECCVHRSGRLRPGQAPMGRVLQDTEGRLDSFTATGIRLGRGPRGSHRLLGDCVLSLFSMDDPLR